MKDSGILSSAGERSFSCFTQTWLFVVREVNRRLNAFLEVTATSFLFNSTLKPSPYIKNFNNWYGASVQQRKPSPAQPGIF